MIPNVSSLQAIFFVIAPLSFVITLPNDGYDPVTCLSLWFESDSKEQVRCRKGQKVCKEGMIGPVQIC